MGALASHKHTTHTPPLPALPPAGADASVVRRTMARIGQPANVAIVFTLPSRYYMTLFQVGSSHIL